MAFLYSLICYSCMVTLFSRCMLHTTAAYTLTPSQSLVDGQTLISQGGTFELGFFSPTAKSKNRYLGIWYKAIPSQTVVWVANRDLPLPDTSGVLKIGKTGNIVIVNQTEGIIWSSNSSKTGENTIAEFLESGNLVLRDAQNGDPSNYFWQSFDYPGNTLLPGMKLGWNLKTGMNHYLSSWKNSDDPSHGDFTYGLDGTGFIEPVMRNGSNKYYRGGPWTGVQNSFAPNLSLYSFKYEFTNNAEEINFMYQLVNQSVVLRLVLTQTGTEGRLQRFRWAEKTSSWVLLVSVPRDRCDEYALCGDYSTCDVNNVALCQCLKGFKPKSPQDWSATDWSEGCERETLLNCTEGEGFIKLTGVKSPETRNTWFNMSMNLDDCRALCLRNCSCMAYANSDIRKGGSGCMMWFTKLIDIRQLSGAGQDLYLRMAASELDSIAISKTKKRLIMTVSFTFAAGIIVLSLGIWGIRRKRNLKGDSGKDGLDLPLYDLETLKVATENFSAENKLGEGGFGPVYKGKLESDQEIAVKRLSKDSIQGIDEFKNEVALISKLQHRNLVRLLGCCIQGEEKMLVYEYMQNKSLDSSLFDETKSRQLNWQKRFDIILGIARGLLYLHHDSRLRIIHRDLKASNILLDSQMVPKISDFGMAKLFGGDQVESRTKRVVGTYGYMSPEYAIDGYFSVKSDVFSFGVLALEIISGKKNRSFSHPDHQHNLLGHAWRLWIEDKALEFVSESMRDYCPVEDVLRCIHIGLLCVQKGREQRPTMSSVVLMLSSETAVLLKPQQPGFYMERSTPINNSLANNARKTCSSNEMSITWLEGR